MTSGVASLFRNDIRRRFALLEMTSCVARAPRNDIFQRSPSTLRRVRGPRPTAHSPCSWFMVGTVPRTVRKAARSGPRPTAIAHHPSPITHRPSPIAHRPSPIAHRPLPIAHRPSPNFLFIQAGGGIERETAGSSPFTDIVGAQDIRIRRVIAFGIDLQAL